MPTNNPLPSHALEDFKDNTLILDNFINSQEDTHPDRFNRSRPTITGIIKEAFSVRTDIANFQGNLVGTSRWDPIPKNVSLTLGGDNGALNKQAQALFNRTEMLKVHSREALRRTYLEVGLNLVEGSFEEGGTLQSITDILLEEKTGKCYSWSGSFPKVIAEGTLPVESGLFLANKLTPAHFGASGTGTTDDTLGITKFIQAIIDGVNCKFEKNKIFNVSSNLNFNLDEKHYEIDFMGCLIRYITPIPTMTYVHVLNFNQIDYTKNTTLKISNLKLDTTVPYFESTTSADRRGIWGLQLTGINHFEVDNYTANNLFYGAGLVASKYNNAVIRNIKFTNVGSKFRPTIDDVSEFDAAGDAIHLYDVVGQAMTLMENINCISYQDKIGRCGIALEAFGPSGISHHVTIKNSNFFGYHRILHQEDGGISTISWDGGDIKDFSNLFVSIQGTINNNRATFENLNIECNPRMSYGGVSGLVNFQLAGKATFNRCFIKYLTDVAQKGPAIINHSTIDIGNHNLYSASWIDIFYNDCELIGNGCTIETSGQTGGFVFNNCIGKKILIKSQNSKLIIKGCDFVDVNFQLINTGSKINRIQNTDLHYTVGVNILDGSYDVGVEFTGTNITSDAISMIYGDGSVDTNFRNGALRNIKMQISNGGGDPNGRDTVQIVGSKFVATLPNFGDSFFIKYNPVGTVQSTIFVDKTPLQTLVKEPNGLSFLVVGKGNVFSNNLATIDI